ncbi:MAG TPA: CHRD domain-containing protein [Vicinamibacterales bacterium]|jgi:hypothetical protein|nr:CHRD domain-containing protein [Vicinamibacterales bacterium]
MTTARRAITALLAVGWLAYGVTAVAQGSDKFSARLGWVPTAGVDRVSGKGTAAATLAGRALTITGSFEGLGGPATVARLHEGIAKGARGKALSDLTVTKATSGTISGSVTLTPEQLESLRQGRLYIQIHGDKGLAPDGANLWGWLLR